MLVIYCIGNLIFVLLFFSTVSYKRKRRKKINKSVHKLWVVYGLSMFLADHIPQTILFHNKKMNVAIKGLCVKDNVEKEKYLYTVQKISICIVVLWGAFFIGGIISFSEFMTQTQYIKQLKRDDSSIMNYNFIVENDNGQQETLNVDVNKREMTEEEIYELFEKLKEPLIEKVLGKNKSVEHIDCQLNLVSSIGAEGVEVSWNISDSAIVGYDGCIAKNISDKGTIVNLSATMMFDNISMDYVFCINVFPEKENSSLQEKVQKYVNENNKNDYKVQLPDEIDGEKVKYYEKVPQGGNKIWIIGIIMAIVLFFLKDRDIKKALNERTRQMLKDYPEIVSKILLYYEAGLSIKSGFEKIVHDYKNKKKKNKKLFRYAYEEMEMAVTKMRSGVSEIKAVNEYGMRCGLKCYLKLSNIIEQNKKRGSRELVAALKEEVDNALLERKSEVLKEGEKISTKLLGPMVMLLIISISLIIVPAYMSISF